MNIFWIEDSSKQRLTQLRKECFTASGLFESEENILFTATSIDDAFNQIEQNSLKYDYYVIDLDLTNFSMGDYAESLKRKIDPKMDNSTFKKKAGHVLFLKLLEKNVSTKRIVFLTGNASGSTIRKWYRQLKNAIDKKDKVLYKKSLANLIADKTLSEFKKDFQQYVESGNIEKSDVIIDLVTEHYDENTDTTFGQLKTIAKNAMIANYPEAFIKADPENFHLWLQESLTVQNSNYHYSSVRRSVIDGCEYWIDQLQSNKYYEDKQNTIKEELSEESFAIKSEDLINYLRKLIIILPIEIGEENKKKEIYNSFLRELSAKWDKPQSLYKISYEKINYESTFLYFCRNQMRMLRNWSAHNMIADNCNEKFLAFCFLTAMRALFKMDIIKLNKYEKQLINSFSEKKTPFFNLKENLAKSYYELRSLKDSKGQVFFDIKNPPTNNFHDLMIIYSKRSRPTDNIKLISEKLFYQNFWHSLFPLNTKLNPLHKGSISFIIKFDDKNKRMPESSFPYKIAQMIYNLSFK